MTRDFDTLIVGAGQAGAQVALSLAAAGYQGTVGLVGAEPTAPYERPPLSKGFLAGTVERDALDMKSAQFWESTGVTMVTGREIVHVDPEAHLARDSHDTAYRYRTLVWAAGGTARSLPIPGTNLQGVYRLRTVEDAVSLRSALRTARRAVVIGGGYIGLETAASLRQAGLVVTVVESQSRLLARVTGSDVSDYIAHRHRVAGVQLHLGAEVSELWGRDGKVRSVRLTTGVNIPADLVLVGVGLAPNHLVLAAAGAACSDGIEVDERCRTSLADIYAIGDCAAFTSSNLGEDRVRLESVQNAVDQAKTVADALLGKPRPYVPLPWFWSHQYDIKLQTVGLQNGHDRAVLRGDPATNRFSVVYLSRGSVIAVDAVNHVRDYVQSRALVATRAVIDPDALSDSSVQLKELA
ncbi:NAD(P)/FAD-dependent oxidoreductase [Rhodococcus artemisiae]|uniref:FAD-dependent oxidoreductase n=1 Tax=Rhodococcus artemisiae TaxID=714159 RepID=A0ABU7LC71_9NOCA|nr:FAD-dependent oxidoreductase [Rhodococcus artemisiae]MEE2059143.1 FAD-dependent oxidoreductase [Rhodococcus artemisiae]